MQSKHARADTKSHRTIEEHNINTNFIQICFFIRVTFFILVFHYISYTLIKNQDFVVK